MKYQDDGTDQEDDSAYDINLNVFSEQPGTVLEETESTTDGTNKHGDAAYSDDNVYDRPEAKGCTEDSGKSGDHVDNGPNQVKNNEENATLP